MSLKCTIYLIHIGTDRWCLFLSVIYNGILADFFNFGAEIKT